LQWVEGVNVGAARRGSVSSIIVIVVIGISKIHINQTMPSLAPMSFVCTPFVGLTNAPVGTNALRSHTLRGTQSMPSLAPMRFVRKPFVCNLLTTMSFSFSFHPGI
jgi:hypothetical protein